MSSDNLAKDEEEFHTAYRVFLDALGMLAMPAQQQCVAMGNFNVAWELKHDVAAGKYLVGRGYLNPEQEAWIAALAGAVEAVPVQVLPAGAESEANLTAMQHASWVPLRVIAAEVLEALSPFTTQNAKYLKLA